jgi:hypothetical protein
MKPIIPKISVTENPKIIIFIFDISSILITDDSTTPPNINLEMSRKYFPNSLLKSASVIKNSYTEKLSPQPQVRDAFGLLNWKPFPFSPSVKSSSVPTK